MSARVAVIDYDLGNLPSVKKALERVGAEPVVIDRGGDLDPSFDAVVLPGVGHFGAGARNLDVRGFTTPLRDWADGDRPLLGICVGLQLFFERSEEDTDARGLGLVPGECRRLEADKVPHMGWNNVEVSPSARVLDVLAPDEMVYFVHSYYVDPEPSCVVGTTSYGQTFCSGLERGALVGVQFHPEKSADVGRRLLERFVGSL